YSCLPAPPPPRTPTPSLHDALPILDPEAALARRDDRPAFHGTVGDLEVAVRHLQVVGREVGVAVRHDDEQQVDGRPGGDLSRGQDRKSTRLNSSHVKISYAVFCLKK